MAELAYGLKGAAQDAVRHYAPSDDPRPLGGYVRAMLGYGAVFAGLARAVSRRGGPPERLSSGDLALSAVASFRAARLMTQASVTSPLRAAVATYERPAAPAEVHEEVREPTGTTRHALGEFLTCPYCVSVWMATGFSFGMVLAPRWTRFISSLLTVDAGADVLQKLYSDLQAR